MAKLSDSETFKLREAYNAHLKDTDGILTAEGLNKIYLECGFDFPVARIKTLAKPMRILQKPSFLEAKMLFMQLKMMANKPAGSGVLSPRAMEAETAAPQEAAVRRCTHFSLSAPAPDPIWPHFPIAVLSSPFPNFFSHFLFVCWYLEFQPGSESRISKFSTAFSLCSFLRFSDLIPGRVCPRPRRRCPRR